MPYQQARGSARIRASVDVNQRLINTSTIVPASKVYAMYLGIYPISDTAGGTEFVLRYGSSVANAPSIGLRNRSAVGDWVVVINTASGSASITLPVDLVDGHAYRVCICVHGDGVDQAAAAASFASAHSGANGTTEVGVVYVYDLSTRTPVASAAFSADADLITALDTNTGLTIQSQVGYSDFCINEVHICTTSATTKAICDLFGQYQKNASALGVTWNHSYLLSYYGTGDIGSTTEELAHLADNGIGDGTATRALSALSSTAQPTWSTESIVPVIDSSEDTVLAVDFDVSHNRNLAVPRHAMEVASKGAILPLAGDSILRPDLAARYGSKLTERLIAAGYEIGSLIGYLRTSNSPIGVTVPSMTNVTTKWYCNDALGGDYYTNPGAASERYGLPCGGIYEALATGTATLGTGGLILTFTITNTVGNQVWFTASDRLKVRLTVYVSDDVSQFTGTVRFQSSIDTVDLDMSSPTAFRQHPQDAAWSAIQAGTGGAAVPLFLNATTVDLDLGTGSTSYAVEVKLPSGLPSGARVCIGNICTFKCDGSGNRRYEPGLIHIMPYLNNSASFSDFHTSSTNTADGTKKHTDAQLGRWLGVYHDDPAAAVLYTQIIQTENASEAATEVNLAKVKTRWDSVLAAMNWTGSSRRLFVSHLTNNVDKDSVISDRQHCIDWMNAMRDYCDADANSAHWSIFAKTKGYMLAHSSRVMASSGFPFGVGEARAVESDATLLAAIGGNADILDSQLIHPSDETFVRTMMSDMVDDIVAATLPSSGGSAAMLRRRRDTMIMNTLF